MYPKIDPRYVGIYPCRHLQFAVRFTLPHHPSPNPSSTYGRPNPARRIAQRTLTVPDKNSPYFYSGGIKGRITCLLAASALHVLALHRHYHTSRANLG
jgi:hypothetical protein